jgi:hypothetical protein
MKKALWILNKYVTGEEGQAYYPYFLMHLQDRLKEKGIELHFVFFSGSMKGSAFGMNNHFYDSAVFNGMSEDEIQDEALRIEQDYAFTFKQAWFPDILQTFGDVRRRKITVPENELNNLEPLVEKFLYLENLVESEKIDVIFSDVSPEAEMEFGRAIGFKYNIPVLKDGGGSFLGRSVLMKHKEFGENHLIEAGNNQDYTLDEAGKFLDDYTKNEGQPSYVAAKKLKSNRTIYERFAAKLKIEKHKIILLPFKLIYRVFIDLYLWFESAVLKQSLYDCFDPDKPYLFLGFHLNQESTMGLRSMPYVNQTALIEMLSRVLPYGYTLYVREHPHWPKTYPYSFLKKCKAYPNVRLLSPNISIHDILKGSRGVIVYNSNTGVEALMHGKPVLSFASNVYYKLHPAVIHCTNLYGLGKKLSQLINIKVDRDDTLRYLQKMQRASINVLIGSEMFLSEDDAKEKANQYSQFLIKGINTATNEATYRGVDSIHT